MNYKGRDNAWSARGAVHWVILNKRMAIQGHNISSSQPNCQMTRKMIVPMMIPGLEICHCKAKLRYGQVLLLVI